MKRSIIIAISLFLGIGSFAQKISISIFNDLKLNTILVTPTEGSYKIITSKGDIQLKTNQIVYLSRVGDSILVRDASTNLGTWPRVSIVGQTENDVIRVKSIMPAFPARLYDENLSIYVEYNRMMAINIVDQEKYIASVVEAEAGPNKDEEFYKAQSLIARTFALAHLAKHKGEGFNLCDGTHCQVYKGKQGLDKKIYTSTLATKNLVIIDTTKQLITAAFHSNCGGFTANSEDVWLTPKSYLVSVEDKHCLGSRNATWEVRIPLSKWKKFLQTKGVDSTSISDVKQYDFKPKVRPVYYQIANKKIPTIEIRSNFKLRSAFFSVTVVKDMVRILGRGYGHGVGLCQEGAMAMANRGWKYDKIINFYFKGIRIVDINELTPVEQEMKNDMENKDTLIAK